MVFSPLLMATTTIPMTLELTSDMKLILSVLRQSVIAANHEFAQRKHALDVYAQQCAIQLGVDMEKWTLNVDALVFMERNGKS